jgi:hypothetical protein
MKSTGVVATIALVALVSGCGSNSSGSSASSSTSAIVMAPASGSTLPDATVNASYSQSLGVSSGGVAPYAFVPQLTPTGLTIAAVSSYQATLSGTPTVTGLAEVVLEVIDSSGISAIVSYALTVKNPSTSLTITPTTLASATLNTSYSQTLLASGGTAPYTWTVSSGTLPPGLTLGTPDPSGTNTLTGTPSASGSYTFTISATDASTSALTGLVTYTITVN